MVKPNPVSDLIKCFTGIRPMQEALGEKHPNIVQNWKKAGRIPHYRRDQVLRAIESKHLTVPADLLERAFGERA